MRTLIISLLLFPSLCRAQDNLGPTPLNYTQKSVWRALFLSPGVSNEFRLGPRTTFVSAYQLTGAWAASGRNPANSPNQQAGFHQSYYVGSVVTAGVRHFYNFERRMERGKSIRANSGNYLMLNAGYNLPPFVLRNEAMTQVTPYEGPQIQALWGFQRTYRRNFYLNLALGVGANTRRSGFAGDFALGYTFPGKQ